MDDDCKCKGASGWRTASSVVGILVTLVAGGAYLWFLRKSREDYRRHLYGGSHDDIPRD